VLLVVRLLAQRDLEVLVRHHPHFHIELLLSYCLCELLYNQKHLLIEHIFQ
jgi:hypothetical protein